jgi:hypothetical protein
MTRKPIRKFLPLTYQPKIAAVQDGTITQSIRIENKLNFQVGDLIAFHGWEGRPYHSSWSFRTPYYEITLAKLINIHEDRVYLPEEKKTLMIGDPLLDRLAAKDGIEPATGEELIRVLHGMHGPGILHGKVLRWDPEPIKEKLIDESRIAFLAGVNQNDPEINEPKLRSVPPSEMTINDLFEDEETEDDQDPVYCGPDPGDQGPILSEGAFNQRLFEKIRQAERDLKPFDRRDIPAISQ